MKISTFSQRKGQQNNDIYICDEREISAESSERDEIYAKSCDIQEKGKVILDGGQVEVWKLGGAAYFVFHTESLDSVGRVVDAMAILESSIFDEKVILKVVEAIKEHCKKSGLTLDNAIDHSVGAVVEAIGAQSKKSWPQKILEFLRGILRRIMGVKK